MYTNKKGAESKFGSNRTLYKLTNLGNLPPCIYKPVTTRRPKSPT